MYEHMHTHTYKHKMSTHMYEHTPEKTQNTDLVH